MNPEILIRKAPKVVDIPFEPLGPLSESVKVALAAEAHRVNMRYLVEFLEEYAYCPFSAAGRRNKQVYHYVHLFETLDLEPLAELLAKVAADPQQVVVQVIFPLLEVDPLEFNRFCHDLTAWAQARLGDDVLATAPLHPDMPYTDVSPATLVRLFRRTPDPTIQWVRLDGLAAIYEGRGSGTEFVDVTALDEFMARKQHPPLWDRIAETNAMMARRMTLPKVEAQLRDFAEDARRSYSEVLLREE